MTRTIRIVVLALLLGAAAAGAARAGVQAAPPEPDQVVLQVRMQAAQGTARPAPRPVEQLDGELRADMSEHLDPRVIALIAGAIGVAGIVAGVRRHKALQEQPGPV